MPSPKSPGRCKSALGWNDPNGSHFTVRSCVPMTKSSHPYGRPDPLISQDFQTGNLSCLVLAGMLGIPIDEAHLGMGALIERNG